MLPAAASDLLKVVIILCVTPVPAVTVAELKENAGQVVEHVPVHVLAPEFWTSEVKMYRVDPFESTKYCPALEVATIIVAVGAAIGAGAGVVVVVEVGAGVVVVVEVGAGVVVVEAEEGVVVVVDAGAGVVVVVDTGAGVVEAEAVTVAAC